MSHQGVLTLSPEQNTWDNLKAEVGFGSHSEACIPGCLLLLLWTVMEARNHHTGGGEGPNLLFKGTSPITLLLPRRPSLLKFLPFSTHWCQRLGSKPLTHGSLRDVHIRTPTQSRARVYCRIKVYVFKAEMEHGTCTIQGLCQKFCWET